MQNGENRVALIVLADTESHADLGRVTNAMMAAREFKEAGDAVELVFDGAGTKWPGTLSDPAHKSHRLYESVHDHIAGACGFCAHAFEATEGVRAAGIPLLAEYHRHPSFRRLVENGYEMITF